ncbi:uncharacterized protein LOC103932948 [Pyrus x bretschneideri]|uniref:uncharacterized protein LOC103932948 n=1 Tax=Pyrus x bretschneideri TaxID=225117 RepID=UPI0020308E23|nr:uncharacterized protein LOC103932948 [Pyrus x bretschneideri]
MSWKNHQHCHSLVVDRQCKIRKRGGGSSSSSSSLVRRYRLKRAILVGKRGGSSTPVPTSKTVSAAAAARSPCVATMMANGGEEHDEMATLQQQRRPASKHGGGSGGKGKEVVSVSARKLAATLWEINEQEQTAFRKKASKVAQVPSLAGSLPPKLSDPSSTPISERRNGSGNAGRQRGLSAVSQKLPLNHYQMGGFQTHTTRASLTQLKDQSCVKPDRNCIHGFKTCLKDVNSGLSTSKELVKVLTRVSGLEEQHSLSTTLLSALRVELDRARVQIHQMIREQRSNCNEIEYLVKKFAEEKAGWKSKERERICAAIACVAEELEVEKKLRRQTERLNKKLGKELADKEAALSKATKELEMEKRAKEIFEQVCNELATGLGEDRAQVEELKKESEKVREEVEKEREMLQLADVLREERVQLKLSEAKYHFEEKNAIVEQLKNELEAHLISKTHEGSGGSPDFSKIKELEAYLKKINFGSFQNAKLEGNGMEVAAYREECEDDSKRTSVDSDLHSIELSMDNNNKSYKWSYAFGDDTEDDSKRTSVDKQFKGRRSLSEKIQWESICLNKNSSGIDWEFGVKSQGHSDGRLMEISELVPQTQTPEHETETKKKGSAKGLTDHRLSNSKVVPIHSLAGTTCQFQSLPMKDPGTGVCGS